MFGAVWDLAGEQRLPPRLPLVHGGDGGGAVFSILAEQVTTTTGQLDHSAKISQASLTVSVRISSFCTTDLLQSIRFVPLPMPRSVVHTSGRNG